MKLSVNFGSHGFNEEYNSIDEAVRRIESFSENSIAEIIVKGTAHDNDGSFGFKDVP